MDWDESQHPRDDDGKFAGGPAKLKKVDINAIRPWHDTQLESSMSQVVQDNQALGYVWKREKRFQVSSGQNRYAYGTGSSKGYAVSVMQDPSKEARHFKTQKEAVNYLVMHYGKPVKLPTNHEGLRKSATSASSLGIPNAGPKPPESSGPVSQGQIHANLLAHNRMLRGGGR